MYLRVNNCIKPSDAAIQLSIGFTNVQNLVREVDYKRAQSAHSSSEPSSA